MLDQLIEFFEEVDHDFPVPISQKQNLQDFSKKLLNRANIKLKIINNQIAGVVAGYIDNCIDGISYISIVAVKKEYRGQRIAFELLQEYIQECKDKKIKRIHLYTDINNTNAIRLYKNLKFEEYQCIEEIRPNDCHLSLTLKNE